MADKKYLSKIVKGGNTLHLKDAEARQEIADIKSSITGAMHFIGTTTSELADGATTNPIVISGENVTAKAGDVAIYGELEFAWNGSKWQEFGSTGSLKALAFKDSASADYTPAGTNADSAVSFAGQADGDFVIGYNDDAVAPSLGAETKGDFATGYNNDGVADQFQEGAFTPAEYGTDTFDGGSLAAPTKSGFATEGEVSTYDEVEETLTFADAGTAQAVTEQGTFTAATYSHSGFSGGSKAADVFTPGSVPTLATAKAVTAQGAFSAGSAATLAKGKAITNVGTATAAGQVFSGTQATIVSE
jgi:hypothetical protein